MEELIRVFRDSGDKQEISVSKQEFIDMLVKSGKSLQDAVRIAATADILGSSVLIGDKFVFITRS